MLPMNASLDVLIDVRALQDPAYSRRGIGRLTTNLLAHARTAAPQLERARFIALVDPALPPLTLADRALFDLERTTANPGALRRSTWFIEASPMTHDPLFVASLLIHPAIFAACVVYDFIPFDEPGRYLTHPAAKLDYYVSLAWLGRYQLFLPISKWTSARLASLLHLPGRNIAVIGAPLDPTFSAGGGMDGARRHVLVAGGADARKNVECGLRAHAASVAFREAQVPLVIMGEYSRAETARLAAIYAATGGKSSLLRFAGRIADGDLALLYRDALAVVVPSRAEGFSLPVIEAMAAGVPVFASAIDVHAELIADPALLFQPDDSAALSRLLERALREPDFGETIVAGQATIWPRFRAEQVAARFWQSIGARAAAEAHAAKRPSALVALATPVPSIVSGRCPRLALLTPLPPDHSGVADYSAASVSELARRVELDLFTATPLPLPIRGASSLQPLSAFPFIATKYDRVVGVIGNSEFHLEIFDLLLRYGGAAIAHDARMLGFYRALLGMSRTREVAAAELGRTVAAEEIERWIADESTLPTLFFGELAAACEPLIFHSAITARLAAERYLIPPRWLPFSLYRSWPAEALLPPAREAARARLGLGPEEIVLVSFGFVHASKLPDECIWALEMLRSWRVPARLYFVGGASGEPTEPIALVRRLGLEDCVHFLDGYVCESTYRDFFLAANLGIQLRNVGFGTISGTLADCIAAGLPTVANAELAETMDAPAYIRRIPDPVSPVLLANALADLIAEGTHLTRPLAESAAYAAEHNFARYADGLCGLLGLETSRHEAA